MYGDKNKYRQISEKRLKYKISTSSGNSGSPIFIYKDGQYFVIGIHTDSQIL